MHENVEFPWKQASMHAKPLTYKVTEIPSHGRGHRFNPCRAHHFSQAKSTDIARYGDSHIGTERRTSAEHGMGSRGKSVDSVPEVFA